MYEYNALVTNVVDADTIDVLCDLGFSTFTKQRLRFARINAYEIRLGKNTTEEEKQVGLEAKQYVKDLIEGKEITIRTEKDTGKYGRYIAEIIFNDINLNDDLVIKKYAIYQEYFFLS